MIKQGYIGTAYGSTRAKGAGPRNFWQHIGTGLYALNLLSAVVSVFAEMYECARRLRRLTMLDVCRVLAHNVFSAMREVEPDL
jgi:hypothetical protein